MNVDFHLAESARIRRSEVNSFRFIEKCALKFEIPHKTTGNGLGIRVVGGKEVPGSNGEIGAYVAKVLPGGATEQTGKILEGEIRFIRFKPS